MENLEYERSNYSGIEICKDGHQGKMRKTHSKNKKNIFEKWQIDILKDWFVKHADKPYLKESTRKLLQEKTQMDKRQISN